MVSSVAAMVCAMSLNLGVAPMMSSMMPVA